MRDLKVKSVSGLRERERERETDRFHVSFWMTAIVENGWDRGLGWGEGAKDAGVLNQSR